MDKVYSDPWFKKNFPRAKKPKVAKSEYKDLAYSTGNTIAFPDKSGADFPVLHEIAHQLTGTSGHGQRYAQVFYLLVEHFIGPKSAKILAQGYREQGRPGWIPTMAR